MLKAYLIPGAALCMLVFSFWVYHMHSENARLGEANTALTEANARLGKQLSVQAGVAKAHAQQQAALSTRSKEQQNAIQAANTGHPDWASQPVPDDVLRALGL